MQARGASRWHQAKTRNKEKPMFRRDKDTKLDNEGLRRMREAIRQRLDQEEGATGDESAEETPNPYRSTTASGASPEPYNPQPAYEPLTRETDYSFLSTLRQDRGVTPVEPSPAPSHTEEDPWTPAAPTGPVVTTIAADTVWRGTLRSTAPVRIEGVFEGEIDTEQDLRIEADARVEANVRAASIVVAGQLNGQITCRERLEVLPSGRVSGQIDAGRFVVHEGAFLGGQVRMKPHGSASGGADDSRPMLQRVR
jgi:cytoskeletal protein CcmA (bactofilin family)